MRSGATSSRSRCSCGNARSVQTVARARPVAGRDAERIACPHHQRADRVSAPPLRPQSERRSSVLAPGGDAHGNRPARLEGQMLGAHERHLELDAASGAVVSQPDGRVNRARPRAAASGRARPAVRARLLGQDEPGAERTPANGDASSASSGRPPASAAIETGTREREQAATRGAREPLTALEHFQHRAELLPATPRSVPVLGKRAGRADEVPQIIAEQLAAAVVRHPPSAWPCAARRREAISTSSGRR